MPYEAFWHLTPRKLKPFREAYSRKKREKDEDRWLLGQYNLQAFRVVMDEVMSGLSGKGRKPKTKYFKEPIFWKFFDEKELTQEELDKRALDREIIAMEQWIENDKARGLPETKIKRNG